MVKVFWVMPQSHFHRYPPVAGRCLDIGGFRRFHRRVTDVWTSVHTLPITGRAPAGRRLGAGLCANDYFSDDPPMTFRFPAGARPMPGRCPVGAFWFQTISYDVLPSIGRCSADRRRHRPGAGRSPANFKYRRGISQYQSIVSHSPWTLVK